MYMGLEVVFYIYILGGRDECSPVGKLRVQCSIAATCRKHSLAPSNNWLFSLECLVSWFPNIPYIWEYWVLRASECGSLKKAQVTIPI